MYNHEQSNDFKLRTAPRFEKPAIPFPRHSGDFLRRPPFPLKRRMMSGRYPNMGFRPFAQPVYRPRELLPAFRYHFSPNSATAVAPQTIPRPPFPNAPPKNVCDIRCNQLPLPPRPASVNYGEDQIPVDPSERRNQLNESNVFSDLWVEALAPAGRTYYFNARTRATTWIKPLNVRIIGLDEINRLKMCSRKECRQNSPIQNQNRYVQQQPCNLYNNSFIPVNFSMPQRLVIFPPPQNMCNPPPILSIPAEPIQNTTGFSFNSMVQPPMFPPPIVNENLMPINKTVDYSTAVTCGEVSKDSEGQAENQAFMNDEEFKCSEGKVSEMNLSESSISLGSIGDMDETNSPEIDEGLMQECVDDSDDFKTENEVLQSSKPEELPTTIIECSSLENGVFSKEPVESKSEEQEQRVDKSRPISSTSVSGTYWYIVWTGDEKVFFYDSQNTVSVWERPIELMNRTDVDKLIEKSPLSIGLKTEKREVRKTTSDGSDVIKKLKIEEKDNENHQVDENFGIEMKITRAKNLKEDEKPKPDAVPHERKVEIFRKMLADNKVSAFSSWEKELHKIVYDPRYLILSSKERKQVFESYIMKKFEEEKNDRQKELQHQREKFISLLGEADINSRSRFSDFAKHYGKDIRFKSVEKPKQRENIFNQYVSEYIKKDRESEKLKAELKKKFIELLSEQKFPSKDVSWSEVQEAISSDERYKVIQSNSFKEKIFKEYIRRRFSNVPSSEKEERTNASLRNREEEVKRDMSVHLKNREREQELHRQKAAVSDFKALLNDLIRNPDVGWHSAKKTLKQDRRWTYVQCLESKRREELFEQYIDYLNSKKKDQFHRMLDELPNITLKSSWLDVRKAVLTDSRCIKFSSSERKCEKQFKEYLRQKYIAFKNDFKELLRETKLINYRSKSLLGDANYLKGIEEVLSQDKRYLNLDSKQNERGEMLLSYIDKLHDEGPPPPPTASEPVIRQKVNK